MKKPSAHCLDLSEEASTCPGCAMVSVLSPAALLTVWRRFAGTLEGLAPVIPPLLLRLVLAYEFWEAGWMKLHGENWFQELSFPFPFSLLPADVNWTLATAFELLGPIALVLGIGTRFISLALMVVTWVAISSVHWPAEWHSFSELLQGYVITDEGHGNYKLPVLYLILFLPLLFGGAGTLSLDAWWADRRTAKATQDCGASGACPSGADRRPTDLDQ